MKSKNQKLMICINGSGGVGKDTFIEFCRNISYSKEIYIANLSTIDVIRQAGRLLGCTSKTEKDREFISDLKWLSKNYNNHPRTYIENQIKNTSYMGCGNIIIFVHSREPEEIKEFKDYFIKNNIVNSFSSVLIKNPKVKNIVSNESDKNVDDYEYEYYIHNDEGLEELRKAAHMFIEDINNVYFTD